jgi:hypothetical protein
MREKRCFLQARDAAAQGAVLLTNNGILPLNSQTLNASRIAVLGLLGGCGAADPTKPPYAWCAAKQAQLDDYSTGWGGFGTTIIGVQKCLCLRHLILKTRIFCQDRLRTNIGRAEKGTDFSPGYKSLRVVTVEAAFRRRGANVTWVPGASPDCQPAQPPPSCTGESYCPACDVADSHAMSAALAAAEAADTVVLVLGDTATGHHLSGTAGEGNDRHSLGPSGAQAALLEAVLAKPSLLRKTVLVHIGGRPMTFGANNSASAVAKLPAILTAMRPGEEGGEGE